MTDMKRHPFDPISFIFGALLLALGLAVLAGDTTRLLGAWMAPAVIIGLGALLLFLGWQSSRPTAADASDDEAEVTS
jgi:hypothetical protein